MLLDLCQQILLLALEEAHEAGLPLAHPRHGHLVQEALRAGVDHGHLLRQRHRLVLVLLEELGEARAALQLAARLAVEIGSELGERGQLAVLREVEPQLACHLAHRLGLGVTTHTRHADTHVQRRPLACVEQVGLQIDLTVGDRDHVGGDEGRHVIGLRLDHRQGGQRAATVGRAHLRGALEQPRVQVEHVARIRLAARRAAQVERQLAVRPRLLGEVVVATKGFLALLHEVLAHRAAGVRGDEVQRCGIGSRGGDDDRKIHRAVLLERRGRPRDRGCVLSDRDVDADEVFALLVDDRVEKNCGLTREAVADDQLALTAPDRDHRVDRFDAGLHRAVHSLAGDDAGGDPLDRHGLGGLDRPLAVKRLAERVDHAADQLLSYRHLEQAPGRAYLVPLVKVTVIAKDDGAHLVFLEVQRKAIGLVRKLQELAGHRVLEAVDLGDAVAGGHDPSDIGGDQAGIEILQPFPDDL